MSLIEIANKDRLIYLFYRKNGKKYYTIDRNFYPYFYEKSPDGEYVSLYGDRLKKIVVSSPSIIPKKRSKDSMESDILYCLHPNTWILTADGNIKKLKDIEIGEKILAKNNSNWFCEKEIIDKWYTKKYAVKIVTNTQDIIASLDHRFLVFSLEKPIDCRKFVWKTVKELKKGDYIVQWMNYEREPSEYRDDWFYLWGYYYGDGSHYSDKRNDLDIADKDKENLLILKQILNSFGIKSFIKKDDKHNNFHLVWNSRILKNSLKKEIPYNFPVEYKLSFIEGIFDAEGHVEKGICRITNTDEKLIYWISSVLFSIGIPNRIYTINGSNNDNYYTSNYVYFLDIYNLEKFKKYIKIRSPKKKRRLEEAILEKSKSLSKNIAKHDVLPIVEMLKLLVYYGNLAGKGWMSRRTFFNSLKELIEFYKSLRFIRKLNRLKDTVSRLLALKIYKEIKEKSLTKGYVFNKLLKQTDFILNHVFFSKIKNIKPIGEIELIDITVEGKNFIANNFATHNCERYYIDKVKSIEKTELHIAFLDIEVLAKEIPNTKDAKYRVSSVSIYDFRENKVYNLFLPKFNSEVELFSFLISFLKKKNYDLIVGFNIGFDWEYLNNRYKRLTKKNFSSLVSCAGFSIYRNDLFTPAGTVIFDYREAYKKIYKKGIKEYSLDYILKHEFGKGKENVIEDFSKLDEKLKKHNIEDVIGLAKIEKKHHILDFYDEIRRFARCSWYDVLMNSRIIDVLLLRQAKEDGVVLPNRGEHKKEKFKGAYRSSIPGYYEGKIYTADLVSAYPTMCILFNLSPENVGKKGMVIDNVSFRQKEGILNKLMRKLGEKKAEIKKLKKKDKSYENTYNAVKSIYNSAFGVCGFPSFRIYKVEVAKTITFLVRDLLHYVEENLNFKKIFIDTDGIAYMAHKNLVNEMNEMVKKWAKTKYGKDIKEDLFESDEVFTKMLNIDDCHYLAHYENGDYKVRGLEMIRSSSSVYQAWFQETLIKEFIFKNKSYKKIKEWVEKERERIKTLSLIDISFPAKVKGEYRDYLIRDGKKFKKQKPIFVRALENSNLNKRRGELFYWLYIRNGVTAIDEKHLIDRELVDWDKMIERNIENIWKKIKDVMGWEKAKKLF